MKKVIIDCDPGHDDAIALMVATSEKEKMEILAIGTIGGNHHLDKVTKNAQLVLQTLHAEIPLYRGCFKPLIQELEVQPDAHGETGMDGLSETPPITYPIENKHAVEAYREILLNNSDVTLIALGPLTNVATLLQMYPETINSIKEISLMGGGIDHGNITPYAEFNIFADPEAARIVFESGIPIIMSGLDVTEKAVLTHNDIKSLKEQGKASHFSYELLEFYHQSGKQFGFNESAMHDACAVAVLTKPELFQFNSLPIEISCEGITRGMTCADKRIITAKTPNVKVAIEVDQPRFSKYILDCINSHDEVK